MSEPLDVLLVGAGQRERALLQTLCARSDVRRVHAAPGRSWLGSAKTLPVQAEPAKDIEALIGYVLSRRIGLVIEGPDGGGLCRALRGVHSFRERKPGCAHPVVVAARAALQGSRGWGFVTPPPDPEAHRIFVPLSHACERDRGYVFHLAPKESS